jgi:diguanylate cyclase (GGDEF)-like protein
MIEKKMIKPDIPKDEASRLKALRSLDILDTPAEERFDRLTRLAKRMFDVPIALVSLVDEDRQWFKSCVGLEVSETPRDISFCGHAILGNKPFIINDTAKDPRFADNPLVLNAPSISFYAGCPLRHFDGSKMGTLCIIDDTPRTLSGEDIAALQDLAEMVERELAAVEMATLDELTRISNRRGFVTLAQKSMDLCARQGIPASLVFFDLNGFKPINDSFGHAEGDRALIAFADQMRSTFRESDVFARLGGDEFVVLLTNTSNKLAKKTIKRFRQSIDLYNIQANRGYEISFSEGIVTVDLEHNQTIEKLLNSADDLMYKMKRAVA